MRLLFAGTPEVALPSLRTLLDSHHEVVGVLTRADAPSGRGRKLRPSPVKALALEAGVPVLTPHSLRDEAVQQQLRELAPEAAPVVAYGAMVPPGALEIPRHGWVNLHFSLLPRWRGAAPAQRAVLAGQRETGLSVFRLEKGLDTGDLLATAPTAIGEFETSGELLERMAQEGAPVLLRALDALEDGTAVPVPQDHSLATHAAKLTPAEAQIDWTLPAEQVSAHIRGMSPQPGAWTLLDGARTKILGVEAAPEHAPLPPGRLEAGRRQLLVGTGTEVLALATLAPAGKRAMRAADWARGAGLAPDAAFHTASQDGETA
ncbi:methionyl-tRNA formyltransferase [Brachybacterium saurashtrense]|uniref:Methionyl-tRNA formyltransferase n=1 Tax=Brachybacterium saurashtrense TaxID=556288 RepID=A0A345YMI4_9MICO|nr:methionyl-tRNA formyltransferase [Brachybacterium saurashtrense]AXK45136.1 methionyl-tRNA formyltransferase [Brachybacterium saurashtrense]RRR22111.1 methionyl-tRNA formyltransferase [Brachybacterium saurashtrense]